MDYTFRPNLMLKYSDPRDSIHIICITAGVHMFLLMYFNTIDITACHNDMLPILERSLENAIDASFQQHNQIIVDRLSTIRRLINGMDLVPLLSKAIILNWKINL